MTPPERPEVAAGMPLATLLSNYRPGWYDPPWSWDDLEATAPSTPEPALPDGPDLVFSTSPAPDGIDTDCMFIASPDRISVHIERRAINAQVLRAALTSEPRAAAPPPAPALPELVRRLKDKADVESSGMDAGEYSDGYDQALDDLPALTSEPRAAAPPTGDADTDDAPSGAYGEPVRFIDDGG